MTLKETVAVMAILRAAYPRYYGGIGKDEAMETARLWASMFDEDDVNTVLAATRSYIATDEKGFPPSIGQIKEKIRTLQTGGSGEMTEVEAWSLIRRAASNGFYGAESEFANLPPELQSLVGSPHALREWSTMETDELETVVASNIMRGYRARAAQVRDWNKLPSDVRALFGSPETKRLSDGPGLTRLIGPAHNEEEPEYVPIPQNILDKIRSIGVVRDASD